MVITGQLLAGFSLCNYFTFDLLNVTEEAIFELLQPSI